MVRFIACIYTFILILSINKLFDELFNKNTCLYVILVTIIQKVMAR